MSVLFVDDDLDILEFYRIWLHDNGIKNFDIATDGAEAWELINSNDYDYVVTDLRMPKMDGVSLINKINHDLEKQSPRVVAVSGDNEMLHGVMRAFQSVYAVGKPLTQRSIQALFQGMDLI